MLIYAASISPRLQYIADFIGQELDASSPELTTDKDKFISYKGVRINYSYESIPGVFRISPKNLLFETGIREQAIEIFATNHYKAFFKTEGDFPFDIFSTCFYLLSRYEEYLPHTKDIFGRYAHENSLAYRENFLQVPLVNTWLRHFKEILISVYSDAKFTTRPFRYLPTYDIDEAFSFRYKNWKRIIGGSFNDVLNGRFKRLKHRVEVLLGIKEDPFYSFGWMNELHRQFRIQPLYFFLVADKISKYDRNVHPGNKALQLLIRAQSENYQLGVHPSWQSNEKPGLIKKEISTIEKITKRKILNSRQHFVKFTLPATFRLLIDAGIQQDFSMGYGSINGFRASVASSFYWYDLEKEQATGLKLYPFCYMEANSFYEQHHSPELALEEMLHYYHVIKEVNGILVTIWHNTFLGTDNKFRGWKEVYSKFYSIAAV